ncbi:MAG TPA: 2-oxo-tetronate isomerase [Terriglobia bacterium]|nr:2-oxo-tetronate isomerase [Terriglobia bacterium]
MPKFAANISLLFTELPFLGRFKAAADAGFTAVECQFPYEAAAHDVADCLRHHEIELALFNMPPGNWAAGDRGLAALPERQSEFKEGVAAALSYARSCGCKRLHMMAGIAEPTDAAALGTYRANLAYAAERAARDDVTVLIEPINQRDMPGYFLSDYERAAELISTIGSDSLRLQFDIYHRQMICGRVIDGLRELLPIIGHIQIAGIPGRHEPEGSELDFSVLFAEIDRLGYDGFIGCEYRPKTTTSAGLGWLSPHLI